MKTTPLLSLVLALTLAALVSTVALSGPAGSEESDSTSLSAAADSSKNASQPELPASPRGDRSPVELVLTPDGSRLVTVNQTSSTLSLIDVASGRVLDEQPCGRRPSSIAMTPDGRQVLVTGAYGGDLRVYEVGQRLKQVNQLPLRFEPRGIALSPDGKTAYVAMAAASSVAVIDVQKLTVVDQVQTDPWPRYLAVSPDGARLAVGCSGNRSVSVIDTSKGEVLYSEDFGGINAGHMRVSNDNTQVYFPFMVYRHNPITAGNIRLGWVLASRIGRIKLTGSTRREAMSLDVPREAMSDPHGLDLTSDEQWMVCTSSGTHELLVYRVPGLPFQSTGGPGDLIDPVLRQDRDRFYRIPLGGRPLGVKLAKDDRHAYIANYLLNCVQVVDIEKRELIRTIQLGQPVEPTLARQGEALFFDARRSLDQWYSCQSCHWDGGTNAVTMDTRNDGTVRTFKTVLPLYNVAQTAPWTWHGWQTSLRDAMKASMTVTMLGPEPSEEQVDAILAYLETLQPPPNPYRQADGSLTESAQRGREVFLSEKAGCANCHNGDLLTDGQIHDVGLGSSKDVYEGFNTPTLLNLHNKIRYLHHGRAKSLEEVLTGDHDPAKVTGEGELTDGERKDLIEYLKSL